MIRLSPEAFSTPGRTAEIPIYGRLFLSITINNAFYIGFYHLNYKLESWETFQSTRKIFISS